MSRGMSILINWLEFLGVVNKLMSESFDRGDKEKSHKEIIGT